MGSEAIRQRRAPEPRHGRLAQHEAVQGDPPAVRLLGLGRGRQLQSDGFAIGEITVHALKSIHGLYTVRSVNQALKHVTEFDTGQLCRPWTYGNYPMHVPNNVDTTVTPSNGRMVVAQGCTPISSADPGIAAYRKLAG